MLVPINFASLILQPSQAVITASKFQHFPLRLKPAQICKYDVCGLAA
ncbi:hypothetical protein [Nostoc sp. PCC 7524]|nr:hypothetical protein [Nostoc sp. PCC 7524]